MKGLPHFVSADLRKSPIFDRRFALEVAKILERMTGDRCGAISNGPSSFTILRISGLKENMG